MDNKEVDLNDDSLDAVTGGLALTVTGATQITPCNNFACGQENSTGAMCSPMPNDCNLF